MIKTMIKGNPFRKKVALLKDAFILNITAVFLKLYSAHGISSISNKRRSELSPLKQYINQLIYIKQLNCLRFKNCFSEISCSPSAKIYSYTPTKLTKKPYLFSNSIILLSTVQTIFYWASPFPHTVHVQVL